MTDIQKGLPNISFTNSNFKLGRKTANDILDAGPGHHTVVEFDSEESTDDVKSFLNGARYICKQHPNVKVARRTDKSTGMIRIYVINNENG